MKTIVIVNQKGGSGKSTATVHLAVAAEQSGDAPVLNFENRRVSYG